MFVSIGLSFSKCTCWHFDQMQDQQEEQRHVKIRHCTLLGGIFFALGTKVHFNLERMIFFVGTWLHFLSFEKFKKILYIYVEIV